jgi:hypothetical protein
MSAIMIVVSVSRLMVSLLSNARSRLRHRGDDGVKRQERAKPEGAAGKLMTLV